MTRLRICSVSSELTPLAKTGGLADVVSALAAYLHRANHDIRVFLPYYSTIDRKLATHPVDFLRNMTLQMGPHRIPYSVRTAQLPGSGGLMFYLIDCPVLYRRDSIYPSQGDEHLRFSVMSRAAIESCQRMAWPPHVFHCHDWHAALIPLYLQSIYQWDRLFAGSRTLLTIHNIGYQGIFGNSIVDDIGMGGAAGMLHQEDMAQGRINFLKTGLLYATAISAVSPTYAREIMSEGYGMGLQAVLRARSESVFGILNGVDYEEWDPSVDKLIPHRYDRRNLAGKEQNKQQLLETLKLRYGKRVPLLGVVTRLTSQKGIDLMNDALPRILQQRECCLVALGSGELRYEQFFTRLQQLFPERVCFHRGYSEQLAHLIEAASDIFLMPSAYEPCGLNQMYSLRYGTVPVVRRTGGLADSVQLYDPDTRRGTGIVFNDYNTQAFSWAVNTALDLYADRRTWRRIVLNAMAEDFSWEKQGAQYVDLYMRLAGL